MIPDKPILLYVGRIDPEKHLEDVLCAVAIAVRQIDFHFVIIGNGIRKSALESLTKKLAIGDRVIFTGFVSDIDLPYFYKVSRCFITASVAELQSLVTLEAMASGLPVIAANAGALSELVHDKINGFLFKPGDVNAIVQCIARIFAQDDLYQKMSKKSLEFAFMHDIHKTITSYEAIYQSHCRNNQ